MDDDSQQQKWNKRYHQSAGAETLACRALLDNQHLLPHTGRSLDLACGLGANALFLAQYGLESHAWDLSDVAIDKCQQLANQQQLRLHTQVRDVVKQPPDKQAFDVIVVSRFLERSIFPAIVSALKPNGILFYQTFKKDKMETVGPSNPAYLLKQNELLSLCQSMRLLAFREENCCEDKCKERSVGNTQEIDNTFRNEAMIIAQRIR